MKRVYKIATWLTTASVLACPVICLAAGPGFGGGVDDGGVSCVPLDGGMSLLVAAGIGYGIKRYSKKYKQEKANNK